MALFRQHADKLPEADGAIAVLVHPGQQVLSLLLAQLVPCSDICSCFPFSWNMEELNTDVGDEILELLAADPAAAGDVECSECHPDGVEVVPRQHPPRHHRAELGELNRAVAVSVELHYTLYLHITTVPAASVTSLSRSRISASVGFMPMARMVQPSSLVLMLPPWSRSNISKACLSSATCSGLSSAWLMLGPQQRHLSLVPAS